jgi:hypothetical protein
MKEYELQAVSQLEGSEGIDSGMYKPPFGARRGSNELHQLTLKVSGNLS